MIIPGSTGVGPFGSFTACYFILLGGKLFFPFRIRFCYFVFFCIRGFCFLRIATCGGCK